MAQRTIKHVFKTVCSNCDGELRYEKRTPDYEVVIDYLDQIELSCDCGITHVLNIDWFQKQARIKKKKGDRQ